MCTSAVHVKDVEAVLRKASVQQIAEALPGENVKKPFPGNIWMHVSLYADLVNALGYIWFLKQLKHKNKPEFQCITVLKT